MKKKLDTYLDLCTQVYEISKPHPPENEYEFYKSYAEDANGVIFEPMCGTGRFLLPLAKDGYNIEGSDASSNMLSRLNDKASKMELNLDVWNGYANEIPKEKSYNLIIIPGGSFGLITNQGDIEKTWKSFYDHLEDGGLFVFEVETKNVVPPLDVWRGSRWKRKDGKSIMLSLCALLDDDIWSTISKYELVDGNKVVQTEIEEYKIKLYKPEDLVKPLKDIGFQDIRMIKAFDRKSSPLEEDSTVVFECRK